MILLSDVFPIISFFTCLYLNVEYNRILSLSTFLHSPSINCLSPCSWGKLCAWTASWTFFHQFPLITVQQRGKLWIFWLALLDIQLWFIFLKPHCNCSWEEEEEKRQHMRKKKMRTRHLWPPQSCPVLSFERYNEKSENCQYSSMDKYWKFSDFW